MMKRFFPYPLFTLAIWLMWLLLTCFSLGQAIFGFGLAIITGRIMARLQPEKVYIGQWRAIPILFLNMLVDITLSNIAALKFIISGGRGKKSGFIIVPLTLKNRTGLAVLACLLTVTPGTAWISYNSKNNELLLHLLDLSQEEHFHETIKQRYEKPLLEIFV